MLMTKRCMCMTARQAAAMPAVPAKLTSRKRIHQLRIHAKQQGDEGSSGLAAVTDTVQSAVNAAANLVPESVPRPVAKGGVAVVGGLILFGLLKQVISGIFTLAVLGALGYWWLTKDSGGADDDDDFVKPSSKAKSTSKASNAEDLDDPLAESRRIMDKYK